MTILRATRAEHLYKLESHLDSITGSSDHEAKLDVAFEHFLIDFASEVANPARVTESDEAFIWPVAHFALHLYYHDLGLAGDELFKEKAMWHFETYRDLLHKVKFNLDSVSSEKSQHTQTLRLVR